MRLVVVGGSGFVGSNLVSQWKAGRFLDGVFDSLLIVDNGSTAGHSRIEGSLGGRVALTEMNAANLNSILEVLRVDDFIIFLAANPDISKGFSEPRLDFLAGTVPAEAIAEACRIKGIRYLFFSSGSGVYGDPSVEQLTENYVTTQVVSPYAASKVAVEALFSAYAHMFGLRIGVARFANLVGPKATHGVVHDFVRKLRRDPSTLLVLGDGRQTKSYLHITDALAAVELICMELLRGSGEPFQVFNVSNGDSVSVIEIANIVLTAGKLKSTQLEFSGGREGWPGDVPRISLSSEQIHENLGWKPAMSSYYAVQVAAEEAWGES